MPEYETAGAAESPQKQTLGPLTFPVAAIEGDRLGKGPLGRREWSFLGIFGAASCSGMTSRVRAEARSILLGLDSSPPTSFLERANNRSLGFASPPSNSTDN
jgi:hypothetical protein